MCIGEYVTYVHIDPYHERYIDDINEFFKKKGNIHQVLSACLKKIKKNENECSRKPFEQENEIIEIQYR